MPFTKLLKGLPPAESGDSSQSALYSDAALGHAPIALVLFSAEGKAVWFRGGLVTNLGWDTHTAAGAPLDALFPEGLAKDSLPAEYIVSEPQLTVLHRETYYRLSFSQAGDGVLLLVMQAPADESRLREEEEKSRQLSNATLEGILLHENGIVIEINRPLARMFGRTREELLGSHFAMLVPPEWREAVTANALRDQKHAYELTGLRGDGSTFPLKIYGKTTSFAGRTVQVAAMRDITDRRRMEEQLRYRVQFEELIASISTDFIGLTPDELERGIYFALQQIGQFTGVDRAYIILFTDKGLTRPHEWCADGIAPHPYKLTALSVKHFPWLSARFYAHEIVHIPSVEALPDEAAVEKRLLRESAVNSVLGVPMVSGRRLVGFLALDSVRSEKSWSDDDISIIKFVAEVFVNAFQRMRTEEALLESEERYKLAATGANDGLWDWNLRTGEIYFSPRWKSMLGYDENDIGSSPEDWFSRVHPDDVARVRADIEAHFDGRTPHFENEHRVRDKGGAYLWMLCRGIAVRDAAGKATRAAGSLTDITVRKAAEERLFFDAFHDSLTGLPNRALFLDRLDRAIRRAARREEYHFAVLFLDLDRFKVINDSLGHNAGDQLLISIARRLEACLRPGDTIARMGGDEFTLLVEDVVQPSDATLVAERVLEELSRPFMLQNQEVFSSVSIGIAMGGSGYDKPEELLRDADTAMYRAKATGKRRYALFDTPMHARALELLHLETELRRAVEREDFQVLYQPIINLKTGQISGFEALLRWYHPLRGLMLTSQVIPLAEETGLIVPIGGWVLREACRQMRQWHDKFQFTKPPSISVNLSGKQFMQANLLKQVQTAIDDSQLDPKHLRLEITESVLMENADSATSIVSQLRVMNISLHIDDFGTGYSSLSYLHRFPIDILKIDRSFISRMTLGEEIEIVRTITSLAHHLGKGVIAEGVETKEQLDMLRALGVEQAQGFFFAKPLDAAEVEALLYRNPVW